MLNQIELQNEILVVKPQGMDKVWSFTNQLSIPLNHILGATIDDGILDTEKGVRMPGLSFPNKWAGSFKKDGEVTFWNADRHETPVVIQLKDEKYARLVLGVDNPIQLVDDINNAI